MSGSNKTIFDETGHFLQAQSPNFSAMESEKPAQLSAILEASDCFKGNKMREAKTLLDGLKKDVEKHVERARENALAEVRTLQGRVKDLKEYSELTKDQQSEIEGSFTRIEKYIQNETLISSIRDQTGRYTTDEYNRLLTTITEWTKTDEEKTVEYVSQSELGVKFGKAYLASEEDVDEYLDALKKALVKAIKSNRRIRL